MVALRAREKEVLGFGYVDGDGGDEGARSCLWGYGMEDESCGTTREREMTRFRCRLRNNQGGRAIFVMEGRNERRRRREEVGRGNQWCRRGNGAILKCGQEWG